MITDALLTILFGLIDLVISLLPDGASVAAPETPAWGLLSAANTVIPIDYILTALGVAVPLMLAGLAFWGVMKVINLIRGSGA